MGMCARVLLSLLCVFVCAPVCVFVFGSRRVFVRMCYRAHVLVCGYGVARFGVRASVHECLGVLLHVYVRSHLCA